MNKEQDMLPPRQCVLVSPYGSHRPRKRVRRFSISGVEEQDDGRYVRPRYRAGIANQSSGQHLPSIASPSSCSTTSLAKLRGKLTVLPPLIFTKETNRIAASPKLSLLEEQDEYERLSNSVPNNHHAIIQGKGQYYSDPERHTVKKKTRYLNPVDEKNTPTLGLAALIGNTDEDTINDTYEDIYKDRVDLVDILFKEALQYGQDKDSGIISGKVTQSSDVVENSSAENVRQKKLSLKSKPIKVKQVVSTDDSDCIEDTPNYVYDRRKRGPVKHRKEVKKNTSEENKSLDAKAVDAFFTQHVKTADTVISPSFARKINETSSDDSEDDCVILADYNLVGKCYNKLLNSVALNSSALEADVLDCVDSIIDIVCSDLEKCRDLKAHQEQINFFEPEQSDDKSSHVKSDKTKRIKQDNNAIKTAQDMSSDDNTHHSKKITLKFKPKKKAPKVNSREKKGKAAKLINIGDDTIFKENINIKSPPMTSMEIVKKKRKLYSPNDDNTENHELPDTKVESRRSNTEDSPIATCYKDLENARQSRIRLPRKRAGSQPVVSPTTKKFNDMFDKIKDHVVNDEKITLVEKRNHDTDVYNMSSESDDEVFKKKKVHAQARISSSSLESARGHRRSSKPVNYTSYYSSEEEKIPKHKIDKQKKPRNRRTKQIPKMDLADERMRTQPIEMAEALNTSFVHYAVEPKTTEEPEPVIKKSVVEAIPPENVPDKATEAVVLENKTVTENKPKNMKIKTEKNLRKKIQKLANPSLTKKGKDESIKVHTEKLPTEILPAERDSTADSPLPGLVVETEQTRKDDFTPSIETTLLQKLKKIYTDVDNLNETRDTQNSLLDAETVEINVRSKINDNQCLINATCHDDALSGPTPGEYLGPILISDCPSEKSIATGGSSPITGHNDLDEAPPNLEALNESFEHRDVGIELMSKSMADFFVNMRNEFQSDKKHVTTVSPVISITRISSKGSARSNVKRMSSEESNLIKIGPAKSDGNSIKSNRKPVITKASSEEIESHLNTPKSKASKVVVCQLSSLMSDTRKSSVTKSPSVVLERLSSEKIEKLTTPTHTRESSVTKSPSVVLERLSSEEIEKLTTPTHTRESSVTKSPSVVLERLSSEEINKWLPMPEPKKHNNVEKPKYYNTRKNADSVINVNPKKRHTQSRVTKAKHMGKISPVKLNFDIKDLTAMNFSRVTRRLSSSQTITSSKSQVTNIAKYSSSMADQCIGRRLGTPDKSTKSLANISVQKIEGNNSYRTAEKMVTQENIGCQETDLKSSAETVHHIQEVEAVESIAERPGTSNSVTSVTDWFKRNAASSTHAVPDDEAATKQMLYEVIMETLETRLVQIHESTRDMMTDAFLQDQEEVTRLEKLANDIKEKQGQLQELTNSLEQNIITIKRRKMDRAYRILRSDTDNKANMISLLKEDIQRMLQ